MFQELQQCFEGLDKGVEERETLYAWIKLLYPGASGVAFYLGEGQGAEVAFPTCERTRSATAQPSWTKLVSIVC